MSRRKNRDKHNNKKVQSAKNSHGTGFSVGRMPWMESNGVQSTENSYETDYERNTRRAEEIVKLGVEAKRREQFEEAKRLYESAANIAPWYLHVYYALGKVNYLMGEQAEALLNYCVAAHLHLGLGPAMNLDVRTRTINQIVGSRYPQALIDAMRSIHPYADLLILDTNTPRHLGHALIDLSPNEDLSPEIEAAASAYEESILGSGRFFIQMDEEIELGLYDSIGVAYLLQHIQWDKVGKYPAKDVRNLYSQLLKSSVSYKAYEVEFRVICDKLTRTIGLRPPRTQTPFATLLDELNNIWEKTDNGSKTSFKVYADQSLQVIEQLLARPLHSTIGHLLFHSLNQSVAFRSSMANRWKDSTGLLQTPVIDFLFKLGQEASALGLQTPVLQAVLWSLKSREVIDLRNGLTHSCYSWIDKGNGLAINIMDRKEIGLGRTVRILEVEVCEAFHGLIFICVLALRRLSVTIANSL
jgi:hypothetical protein